MSTGSCLSCLCCPAASPVLPARMLLPATVGGEDERRWGGDLRSLHTCESRNSSPAPPRDNDFFRLPSMSWRYKNPRARPFQ